MMNLSVPASRTTSDDFILITPSYPTPTKGGGEFVRTRVEAYASLGLNGRVVLVTEELPHAQEGRAAAESPGRPEVMDLSGAERLIDRAKAQGTPLLVHSPSPNLSRIIHEKAESTQSAVWYHGYEVRDFRRLAFNFTPDQLARRRQYLRRVSEQRLRSAFPLFGDRTLTKIFVSDFQRRYAEWDVGTPALQSHVIPNYISSDYYRPRLRSPSDVNRLLLLRSFNSRNYANDIAIEALLHLSRRSGFSDLEVTIRGFGNLFEELVQPLYRFSNVRIQQTYSSPAQMALSYHSNGVFLCPTRFDTQGVQLGEAMATGMVAVTNPIGGINEYVKAGSALLPRPNDPLAFADAIWSLQTDPSPVPSISRMAAESIRHLCGMEATIHREVEIIRRLAR